MQARKPVELSLDDQRRLKSLKNDREDLLKKIESYKNHKPGTELARMSQSLLEAAERNLARISKQIDEFKPSVPLKPEKGQKSNPKLGPI